MKLQLAQVFAEIRGHAIPLLVFEHGDEQVHHQQHYYNQIRQTACYCFQKVP
ncbi:MAG: hypothetical protein ACKO1F_12160 [Flammeovirgaceae bacterium]